MLNLDYKPSESDIRPDEIDDVSSPTTVYLRKNIHTEKRQDETRTVWVYDEAKVPRQEYNEYMQKKAQADIEYLYMMGGYDYDE